MNKNQVSFLKLLILILPDFFYLTILIKYFKISCGSFGESSTMPMEI